MASRIRTINFLPEVFQTTTNAQFLQATLDQLVDQPNLKRVQGYIGSKVGYGINSSDTYVTEPTKTRTDYQLDPAVIFLKPDTDTARDFISYPGILDAIKLEGGLVNNQSRLFNNDFYSWDPFVDYDMVVNYSQYFWLPYGPQAVIVSTETIYETAAYSVTPSVKGFQVEGLQPVNPTITLLRGGTYQFVVDQTSKFWIQGVPGVTGTDPNEHNIDTREILGVYNNGASKGVVTFTVPAANAQERFTTLTGNIDADIVSTMLYDDLNGKTVDEIGGNIDGVTDLDGKTLIFYNENEFPAISVRRWILAVDPITGVISVLDDYTLPTETKITINLGNTYYGREFFLDASNNRTMTIVPYLSATKDVLYYQDSSIPNNVGIIKLVEDNTSTVINVETDILGKKVYVSPNGVTFINGLKVRFEGDVVPAAYDNQEFYVAGVGEAIELVPVNELVVTEPYYSSKVLPWENPSYDVAQWDIVLYIPEFPDYITIARNARNRNAWSRSNRWFHRSVIDATGTYNNITDYAGQLEASRAKRPIIQFRPNIELFNSGIRSAGQVDFVDVTTTDAFSQVAGPTYMEFASVAAGTNYITLAKPVNPRFTNGTEFTVNTGTSMGQQFTDVFSATASNPAKITVNPAPLGGATPALSTGDQVTFEYMTSPAAKVAFISNITKSIPAIMTVSSTTPSPLVMGDNVIINSVTGMTQVNYVPGINNTYFVRPIGGSQFELYTDSTLTTPLDSRTFTSYVAGGTASTNSLGTWSSLNTYPGYFYVSQYINGGITVKAKAGTSQFTVETDVTTTYVADSVLSFINSGASTYIVDSSSYDPLTLETTINVKRALPTSLPNGTPVYSFSTTGELDLYWDPSLQASVDSTGYGVYTPNSGLLFFGPVGLEVGTTVYRINQVVNEYTITLDQQLTAVATKVYTNYDPTFPNEIVLSSVLQLSVGSTIEFGVNPANGQTFGWLQADTPYYIKTINLSNQSITVSLTPDGDVYGSSLGGEGYMPSKSWMPVVISQTDNIDHNNPLKFPDNPKTFTGIIGYSPDPNPAFPMDAQNLLYDGAKVIFANDSDLTVRNNIYTVNMLQVGNNQFDIVLEKGPAHEVLNDSQVSIVSGYTRGGTSYWYKDTVWNAAQQKNTVNQPPLFNVFNNSGISFGDNDFYPGTNFAGSTLFQYAVGTGVLDTVLGFPLKYSSLQNIGDIEFDVTFNSTEFTYLENNSTVVQLVSDGYVHEYVDPIVPTRLLGWQRAAATSLQYQVFQFEETLDNVNKVFVCDVTTLPQGQTVFQNIQVFVNNTFIDQFSPNVVEIPANANYTYVVDEVKRTTTITLHVDVAVGSSVQFLIASNDVSATAYYEVPTNLENNPFNVNIQSASLGDIRGQFESIFRNTPDATGYAYGSNNTNNLGNLIPYGTRIIQNSASLVLPGCFLRTSDHNVFNAIQYNSAQYEKFKQTVIYTVEQNDYSIYQLISTTLDQVLDEIAATKTSSSSFFWSDMMVNKTPYITNSYTTNVILTDATYPLSRIYDYTSANYYGVAIYIVRTINGEPTEIQLTTGVDYVISSDSPSVTITAPILPGDTLTINEYNQTYGSYVPNTPTKLGMYPRWIPAVVYDTTYINPTYFILGHDGSLNKLYGEFVDGHLTDIRDKVLLQFEQRIYNNLKVINDPPVPITEVKPGQWRDTQYSNTEYVDVYRPSFLNWAGFNKIDYANQVYLPTNAYTWNYNESTNKLDNQPIEQGFWRGVYIWLYDTTDPSQYPWQMLGFTEKPSWWETRYGQAPYTSGNELLWGDLRDGLVWNDGASYVLPQYVRPQLLSALPVNSEGELLSPFDVIVSNYDGSTFERPWIVGDDGPSEYSYQRSSSYPFDLMRVLALTKPAQFFNLNADLDRYRYSSEFGQYLYDNRYHLDPRELQVYGNGTAKHSYINWIVDYEAQYGLPATDNIKTLLLSLDVRLVYRMAGFSDKKLLQFIIEKSSPNSNNNSLLIPDDNYQLLLYTNQPFDRIIYSGMIVQRTNSGYAVYGNGQNQAFFTTLTPNYNGNYNRVSYGTKTVIITKEYYDTLQYVPYGTVFTSVEQLSQFIASYSVYLETQGMQFLGVDADKPLNWTTMIQELLYWVQSGWESGSIIDLNPSARYFTVNKLNSIVQPLTIQQQNFILNQNLYPINLDTTCIHRIGTEFTVQALSAGDTFAYAQLNLSNFENGVVFDNVTSFNDLIYNPVTGLRQQRIIMRGSISNEWNGLIDAQGFIINQTDVAEWNPNSTYSRGDLVKYKSNYWVAVRSVQASDVFNPTDWTYSDYSKIDKGMLPNPSTRAAESLVYYDSYRGNLEDDGDLLSYSLIGFRQRRYMDSANLSTVSQLNVYKNFIKEKGTNAIANAFKGAIFQQGAIDYDIYENWEIKTADYGAVLNQNFVELPLLQSKLAGNPAVVGLTATGYPEDGVQEQLFLRDLWNYGRPITNVHFLPTVDADQPDALPSAGYAMYKDVNVSAFTIDSLNSSAASMNGVNRGNYLWIANEKSTWQVFSAEVVGANIVRINNNRDGTVTVQFDGKHNLAKLDPIAISEVALEVNGFYIVEEVLSITSVKIVLDLDATTTSITQQGIALKLISQRVAQPSDIATLPNLLANEFNKLRVWVDDTPEGGWAVYQKAVNYTYALTINNPNANSSDILAQDFGKTVTYSTDIGYLVADPLNGLVYRYAYSENYLNNFRYIETVPSSGQPSPLGNFGTAMQARGKYLAVSSTGTQTPFLTPPRISFYRLYREPRDLIGPGRLISAGFISIDSVPVSDDAVQPQPADYIGFGTSMAYSVDRNWLVVGAPGSSNVFVFQMSTNGTNIVGTLVQTISGPADSQFGMSVVINDDASTIVISAPNNASEDGLIASNIGATYIYQRGTPNITQSSLVQVLYAPAQTYNSYYAKSIDTTTQADEILVGAPYEVINSSQNGVIHRYTSSAKSYGYVLGATLLKTAVIPAGILYIDGTPVQYIEFGGVTATTTSASGSGATFSVNYVGSNYTVVVEGGGTNYVVGELLVIPGTSVGGDNFTNDIFVTVTAVLSGAIVTVSHTGTSSGLRGISAVVKAINNSALDNIVASEIIDTVDPITSEVISSKLMIETINKATAPKHNVMSILAADGGLYTALETLTSLGISLYTETQVLTEPHNNVFSKYGWNIKYNEDNSFIVAAPAGNRYDVTTFDFTDDQVDNDTKFDRGTTQFVDSVTLGGAVYMYDYLPAVNESLDNAGQYVYSQSTNASLTDTNITSNYGSGALSFVGYRVVVGTPTALVNNRPRGNILFFKNASFKNDWSVHRKSLPVVDINRLQTIQIYNRINNLNLEYLDYIDPLQGKLLGAVQQNIDYTGSIDPAGYTTTGDINTNKQVWGADQLGKIWFDTTNVRYINTHQDDIEYNSTYWGTVFPGSDVKIYVWIASDVEPLAYVGSGLLYDATKYSIGYTIDSNGNLVSTYYFWVSNNSTVYEKQGKTLNTQALSLYVSNPIASGIAYLAPLSDNIVAMYNCNNSIQADSSVLHIGFGQTITDEPAHEEFELIRDGYADDFLSGLPNDTVQEPTGLYAKMVDSFAGLEPAGIIVTGAVVSNPGIGYLATPIVNIIAAPGDIYGSGATATAVINDTSVISVTITNPGQSYTKPPIIEILAAPGDRGVGAQAYTTVREETYVGIPNYYLTPPKRYGVAVRPKQSMFVDRLLAVKNFVQYCNEVMAQYPITEFKNPTFLNTSGEFYDTKNYWSYADWWATGYSNNTKITAEVPGVYALETLQAINGEVVRVTIGSGGNSEFFVYEDGAWIRIGLTNGTIQLDASLYDYDFSNTAWGDEFWDVSGWDDFPGEETWWIVRAMIEQIFTDTLLPNRNALLILMFDFIQSEARESQNFLPWLDKTSFIDVINKVRDLLTYSQYQEDNQEFLAGYINEVKPYHVVIKDFAFKYDGFDDYQGYVTDFDVPASYDSVTQTFISPQIAYNQKEVVQGKYLPSNPIWQTSPYREWYSHYGLSIQDDAINNTTVALTTAYVAVNARGIQIDNAWGIPEQGLIQLDDELIIYTEVDRLNGILGNLSRGYDNTLIANHLPGTPVLMKLPGVIVLDGGRGYTQIPAITVSIDESLYPVETLNRIVKPELIAQISNGIVYYIQTISPGFGYPVQPKFIVDSSPIQYSFGYTNVNVNTTSVAIRNTIVIPDNSFVTGDSVRLTTTDGSVVPAGLVDGDFYYVGIPYDVAQAMGMVSVLTPSYVALYYSKQDALLDQNRIPLFNTGEGDNCVLAVTARISAFMTNAQVRDLNTVLNFDRTSYTTQVTPWIPNGRYQGLDQAINPILDKASSTGESSWGQTQDLVPRPGLGTIIVEANSFTVYGSFTAFEKELSVGSVIIVNTGTGFETVLGIVASIESSAQLTLTTRSAIAWNGHYYLQDVYRSDQFMASNSDNLHIPLVSVISTVPVVVKTQLPTNLESGTMVYFQGIRGTTELNFNPLLSNYYYVRVMSGNDFWLYEDAALTTPVDGMTFNTYTGGGDVFFGTDQEVVAKPRSLVTYNNVLYRCVVTNDSPIFNLNQWEVVSSDDLQLNALDRIAAFYKPTVNMPGNDATQLVANIEYPNNTYKGAALDLSTRWDIAPWDIGGWEDVPVDLFIDTKLRSPDTVVDSNALYDVSGGAFSDGYGPEELVAGVVQDRLDLTVMTRPGSSWNATSNSGYTVVSMDIVSGGEGYAVGDLVRFIRESRDFPLQAEVTAIDEVGGAITEVRFLSNPSDYQFEFEPSAVIKGGALVTAVLGNGYDLPTDQVAGVTVVLPGQGYLNGDEVIFSAPEDDRFVTATGVVIANALGEVIGVQITESGGGYSAIPSVTIPGSAGTGADISVTTVSLPYWHTGYNTTKLDFNWTSDSYYVYDDVTEISYYAIDFGGTVTNPAAFELYSYYNYDTDLPGRLYEGIDYTVDWYNQRFLFQNLPDYPYIKAEAGWGFVCEIGGSNQLISTNSSMLPYTTVTDPDSGITTSKMTLDVMYVNQQTPSEGLINPLLNIFWQPPLVIKNGTTLGTGSLPVGIGYINVTNGGSGYTALTVGALFSAPGQAWAQAVVTGGAITNVILDYPGYNYSLVDAVSATIVDPAHSGTDAQLDVVVDASGRILEVLVIDQGSGYSADATVVIQPPRLYGRAASGYAVASGGVVTTVVVTDPGFGYYENGAIPLTDLVKITIDAPESAGTTATAEFAQYATTVNDFALVSTADNNTSIVFNTPLNPAVDYISVVMFGNGDPINWAYSLPQTQVFTPAIPANRFNVANYLGGNNVSNAVVEYNRQVLLQSEYTIDPVTQRLQLLNIITNPGDIVAITTYNETAEQYLQTKEITGVGCSGIVAVWNTTPAVIYIADGYGAVGFATGDRVRIDHWNAPDALWAPGLTGASYYIKEHPGYNETAWELFYDEALTEPVDGQSLGEYTNGFYTYNQAFVWNHPELLTIDQPFQVTDTSTLWMAIVDTFHNKITADRTDLVPFNFKLYDNNEFGILQSLKPSDITRLTSYSNTFTPDPLDFIISLQDTVDTSYLMKVASVDITRDGSRDWSNTSVYFSQPETFGGVTAEGIAHIGYGVESITITDPGRGYLYPQVIFSEPQFSTGTLPVAVAELIEDGIGEVLVQLPGNGLYTIAPAVEIQPAPGDTGSGAVAHAVLSDKPSGKLSVVNVSYGGSGYIEPPLVQISAPASVGGVRALAVAQLTGDVVTSIVITNPGGGYKLTDTITVSISVSPTSDNATIDAADIHLGYSVGSFVVTETGSGYNDPRSALVIITTDPADNPQAGGAFGQPTPSYSVGNIVLGHPGSGYTSAPTVSIVDGDPSVAYRPAQVYAELQLLGKIDSIEITNPGSGYTKVPKIYFDKSNNANGVEPEVRVNTLRTSGAVGTVHRQNVNTTTVLTQDLNLADTIAYVKDAHNLVHLTQYSTSIEIIPTPTPYIVLPTDIPYDQIGFMAVYDAQNETIGGNKLDPSEYYIDLSGYLPGSDTGYNDGLPKLIFTNPEYAGYGVFVVIGTGRTFKLGGEIIGFDYVDFNDNSVHGLRRGVDGTGAISFHPAGEIARGLAPYDVLPEYYWTSDWQDDARGPLQTSSNPAAEFLQKVELVRAINKGL